MRGVRHVDRHSGIDEPLRGGAEQTLLVDRLVGPHSLQLRRTIRRDDDERRARVGRLDDRGMKLRRRGPRCCEHDRGLSGRFAQAHCKERAASLVDMDDDLDSWMALHGHGHRRGARSRRDASELDALRRELVDEGGGKGLRYIRHRIES